MFQAPQEFCGNWFMIKKKQLTILMINVKLMCKSVIPSLKPKYQQKSPFGNLKMSWLLFYKKWVKLFQFGSSSWNGRFSYKNSCSKLYTSGYDRLSMRENVLCYQMSFPNRSTVFLKYYWKCSCSCFHIFFLSWKRIYQLHTIHLKQPF